MTRKAALQRISISLVIALGVIVIYAPTRTFDFVTFDDPAYIIRNYNVNQGLSGAGLKWAFNAGYCSNWHPVTWLSHALDCQIFGIHPGPMHLVNVGLHTANGVILFLLLCGMTGRVWPSALVSALFVWHPMHVESVAWISERKDVLSALFFLLTIWAYWRYTIELSRAKSAMWSLTAMALCALGLMSKPMLVTLPFILLLLDFWPLGRFAGANSLRSRMLALTIEKLPYFVLCVVSCVMTLIAQNRGRAVMSLQSASLGIRLTNILNAYAEYLEKLIWPRGLNVIYPYVQNTSIPKAAGVALVLAALSTLALLNWRKRPYLLVGWFWFLGMLVPVIGLVQVGGQSMADRYTYLPSIGFFIAICWLASDLADKHLIRQAVLIGFGVAALAACISSARAQVFTWKNGGTLFSRAIEVDPNNYIAHADYAYYLLLRNDLKGVDRECKASIQLQPDYELSHEYLGYADFRANRPEAALAELQTALQLDPAKASIHSQLGDVYVALNRPETAEREYRDYLAADPIEPTVHYGLAKALAAQNKWQEARTEFAIAAKCPIPYAQAHAGLALALSTLGRPDEAIDEYRAALRIHPDDLDSLNNLAWLLAATPAPQLRNGAEAVSLAQHACQLTGFDAPQIIGTLAAAYAEAGRFHDAVATAQKAHDVALAQTNAAVASRNLQLMEMYRRGQAYHEQ